MTTNTPGHIPANAAPPSAPIEYGAPISLSAAKQVAAAAEAEAAAHGWPMVIAIFDSTAHLVLLHRLDQSNIGAVVFAQRKAETAVRFRRATKVYEEMVIGGGLRMLSVASDIIALEGGVPLIQGGKVVGSIGVSGMASDQDGVVANAGARVLS
jgi:glc operon protein GlcG